MTPDQLEGWIADTTIRAIVDPRAPRLQPGVIRSPARHTRLLRSNSMTLRDTFSMRQRPRGPFKWLLHAPVHLYRAGLGWVFGERFLLITHRGRTSGELHRTVVEVVCHDASPLCYVVCSGTGPTADWYRNLRAEPTIEVQVGNRAWHPTQHLLSDEDAARCFERYEQAHPKTAGRLLKTMGNSYDGTAPGRVAMMRAMPMVAFGEAP